ncbi:Nsun2 [Symbiodinium microadriaticum]|nr:Nsun2 [Symbiodinium microadriaticum]
MKGSVEWFFSDHFFLVAKALDIRCLEQLRHHINAELQRTQNWIDFEVQRFISNQWPPAPDDAKEVSKDGTPKDKDTSFKDGSGKDSPRASKSHSPRSRSHSPRVAPTRREEKQVTTNKPNVPPVNLKDAQNWHNAQNQWGIHDGDGEDVTPTGQVRLSPRQANLFSFALLGSLHIALFTIIIAVTTNTIIFIAISDTGRMPCAHKGENPHEPTMGCAPTVLRSIFYKYRVERTGARAKVLFRELPAARLFDRRLKIEDAWESFWGIFNLQSSIQHIGSFLLLPCRSARPLVTLAHVTQDQADSSGLALLGTGACDFDGGHSCPAARAEATREKDEILVARHVAEEHKRPEPSATRDSALALALERSQALRRAADQESEVLRLTMLVERRELSELQRLRREHREAREQTAALRAEVQQTKSAADETRQRLEKMLTEQREHMEALEESAGLAERELQDRSMQSADMEIALFSCLQERTSLLQFMVDLLSALQTLFYDPTPFTRLRLRSASPPPGIGLRCPLLLWNRDLPELLQLKLQVRQGGGGALRVSRPTGICTVAAMLALRSAILRLLDWQFLQSASLLGILEIGTWLVGFFSAEPLPSAQAMKDIGTTISGGDDLRELCTALEAEIAQASQAFSAQVQRVLAEAEQSARAIGSAAPGQSLRACGLWVEQEKRRKEKQGLPSDRAVPSVDWAEERAQYLATTRAMEAKFAQLTKLRRLLQVNAVQGVLLALRVVNQLMDTCGKVERLRPVEQTYSSFSGLEHAFVAKTVTHTGVARIPAEPVQLTLIRVMGSEGRKTPRLTGTKITVMPQPAPLATILHLSLMMTSEGRLSASMAGETPPAFDMPASPEHVDTSEDAAVPAPFADLATGVEEGEGSEDEGNHEDEAVPHMLYDLTEEQPKSVATAAAEGRRRWPAFAAYYEEQGIASPAALEAALAAMARPGAPFQCRFPESPTAAASLARLRAVLPNLAPVPWAPKAFRVVPGQPGKASDPKKIGLEVLRLMKEGDLCLQDVSSMLPVLAMKPPAPDMACLDMCAAPGSKAMQLLDALTSAPPAPGRNRGGFLVANERSEKRARRLLSRARWSPALARAILVCCTDAAIFPALRIAGPRGAFPKLRYDRVICDVPCSGDGQLRKTQDKFEVSRGLALHPLQLRILRRGLQLLAPGGQLVYSTCSLNPIEDEAVVAAALVEAADCEIVPLPARLLEEDVGLHPGISFWVVPGSGQAEGYAGKASSTAFRPGVDLPTMRPPPASSSTSLQLKHCRRALPTYAAWSGSGRSDSADEEKEDAARLAWFGDKKPRKIFKPMFPVAPSDMTEGVCKLFGISARDLLQHGLADQLGIPGFKRDRRMLLSVAKRLGDLQRHRQANVLDGGSPVATLMPKESWWPRRLSAWRPCHEEAQLLARLATRRVFPCTSALLKARTAPSNEEEGGAIVASGEVALAAVVEGGLLKLLATGDMLHNCIASRCNGDTMVQLAGRAPSEGDSTLASARWGRHRHNKVRDLQQSERAQLRCRSFSEGSQSAPDAWPAAFDVIGAAPAEEGRDWLMWQLDGTQQVILFAPDDEKARMRGGKLFESTQSAHVPWADDDAEPCSVVLLKGEALRVPGGWYLAQRSLAACVGLLCPSNFRRCG